MDASLHREHEALHREHEAYRQRFRTLTAQFRAIHAEWKATVPEHDHARMADLVNQESALVTEVHTLIATFQARIAARHPPERAVVDVEALREDPP